MIAGVAITTGMLVVFAIVLAALLLFVTEAIPVDTTAILIIVMLVVFEPWTTISPREGISGFANPATITVLALLFLSEGIRQTGAVQLLAGHLAELAGDDPHKQLAVTVGLAGPASGFINNTPVVALLVSVVSDMAHQTRTSPSKLLIPLSYASMLGGTLTLIGTSTNILASELSRQLIGHPFSMFEFTSLGALVLVVGTLYLVTVGARLVPERIPPEEDFIGEYEMAPYLTRVAVDADSPLIGAPIDALTADVGDFDVLQIRRGDQVFVEPVASPTVRADDQLIVRADRRTLLDLMAAEGLSLAPTAAVVERDLETTADEYQLVELVLPSGSALVGRTIDEAAFQERYDAIMLALRRHGELIHTNLDALRLQGGDTLLVQASEEALDRLSFDPDLVVVHEVEDPHYRQEKISIAVAILLGVVGLAAVGPFPILVTALGGVVAMVLAGVVDSSDLYDIDWGVIVLLAGVIPLGLSLERTGGADFLAALVVAAAGAFSDVTVLWLFYLLTVVLTNLISNNAAVVLLLPVAVTVAQTVDANPFAFVLAVTFAASTAFLTPVGYQTNLFVYGPGGYRFTDFFRVGAPLQLILSGVTVAGIVVLWGV